MPPTPVHVEPVRARRDERAFAELPYALYRDDAHWVPPLRIAERRRWSPKHNASLRAREVERFIARRGRRVIGRIAAVRDPVFAERWARGAGFFGFFECEPDEEAAQALFDAAHAWLRDRGATSALGPVNLSTHEEVGLLVDGFDAPPTVLTPYNPPRYVRHVTDAGYRPERDYLAFRWTPSSRPSGAVERLTRQASGHRGAAGRVRVRAANPSRWEDEVHTLHALYNGAFDGLWGFVPMTWEEFSARASEFRAFYKPELVLIAEVDGEPAGFGLALPDVNAALRRVGGRLLPLGWLRLVRDVPRLRTGRFILAGVLPRFVGLGVAPLIARAMADAGRRVGMEDVELSLVQATNSRMRRVIEAFGCPPCKTYRLYARAL